MKTLASLLFLFFLHGSVVAQYDKEKLSDLLVANAWSVKSNVNRQEKKMVFSRDHVVLVDRDNGKGVVAQAREKWSLTSGDNIRWFLAIGATTYELIVSYTKTGSQYLKLTHQDGSDKITGYYEINLYATK